LPLEKRLEQIRRDGGPSAKHQPHATAVESLFQRQCPYRAGRRSGPGVALLACSQAGCEVFEYTPQQIKQAVVGYGKASKEQVMEMVRVLLALPAAPRSDHAADALGVAICHANTCGIRESIRRSTDARTAGGSPR
jgi:crossover junction endodeoxyribonuclease RuvC